MTSGPWPRPVSEIVSEIVGGPANVETLGGMSGSSVIRVVGPGGSIVVKGGVSAREAAVYRSLSPALADAGVRIPTLHAAVDVAGRRWLVLEDVPAALPRERWLADGEVLTTLHRLHRLDPAVLGALPDHFRPTWSEAMTTSALGWLGNDFGLGRHLTALRDEASPLFEPRGLISGDPNPLNWGIARSGALVLMDWERIGLGHPAIDVAITIHGLPTRDEFDRVAAVWRTVGSSLSVETRPMQVRDLVLAKLWTVIELLAETPPLGNGAPVFGPLKRRQETAVAAAERVPGWLRQVT